MVLLPIYHTYLNWYPKGRKKSLGGSKMISAISAFLFILSCLAVRLLLPASLLVILGKFAEKYSAKVVA